MKPPFFFLPGWLASIAYAIGSILRPTNRTPDQRASSFTGNARPTNLMLKPITRELLAKGNNTLMVEITPGGPGGQVALKRGQ